MNLLFLCTGNTCRSPMAEAIALDLLRHDGGFSNTAVTSAGLAAFPGDGATPAAVRVCEAHGLDIRGHRSKALTTDLAFASDHIYTMTLAQAAQLRQILPQAAARIEPLSPQGDIADPFGGSDDTYQRTYEQIEAAIKARLDEWKNESTKGE